jgi:preprotein translocase subunit YajC
VESVGALLPFVLILLAFYMLIIRPARKRQGAASRLQDSLHVGQEVMTTSGMYAEIVGIDDDAVVLETSPGVRARWAKPAVARILTESETDTASPTDTETDTDTAVGSDPQDAAPTSTVDPDASGKRPD